MSRTRRKKPARRRRAASEPAARSAEPPASGPGRWPLLVALPLVFVAALAPRFIGLRWGQPNSSSWHSDSIAGRPAASQQRHVFGTWSHKYPRGQFLLLAPLYGPVLAAHRAEAAERGLTNPADLLTADELSGLILTTRTVTAVMGAGAVVFSGDN